MKTEAWPCRYKSRSQRLPAGTRSWKSKGSFVPRALEVAWPCWDLGFWLTASSTVIEHISVVLSYPVCGTLYSNSRKPTQLHENIIYADYGVFWCPFQFAPQVSAFLSWPYCWLCPLIYPFATTQWGAHRGKLPISTFWYDIYNIWLLFLWLYLNAQLVKSEHIQAMEMPNTICVTNTRHWQCQK